MTVTQKTNFLLIASSFLIGVILTIMPLPQWAIWFRPQWLFAILLFWVITSPAQCGIVLAWIVGIGTDLITGTPLGEHAIVFVFFVYIILKCHSAIVHFFLIQQASLIAFLVVLSALLQGFILGVAGHTTHMTFYVLSAITTAMIWPWLYKTLDKMRPKAFLR